MKNRTFIFLFNLIIVYSLYAQEALKSATEEYYNFLSLQGFVERPTLNYRTFSDSVWVIDEEIDYIWQEQNLGNNKPVKLLDIIETL